MPRLATLTSQTLLGLRMNRFPVQLLYTLDNPNFNRPAFNDNFGYSVAIADSWVIVGAPNQQVSKLAPLEIQILMVLRLTIASGTQ